jgi:hypothetical protein
MQRPCGDQPPVLVGDYAQFGHAFDEPDDHSYLFRRNFAELVDEFGQNVDDFVESVDDYRLNAHNFAEIAYDYVESTDDFD